jgi:PAS domain S-box-containing protein
MNTDPASSGRVLTAFGAAIAILIIVGALSYRSIVVSEASDRSVLHTRDVIGSLQKLSAAMAAISSSIRRFVITGAAADLVPYQAARLEMARLETELRGLTSDNPAQLERLAALETLAAGRVARAESIIDVSRTQSLEAARDAVRDGPTAVVSSEYNKLIEDLQSDEQRLLAERKAAAAAQVLHAQTMLVAGTLFGLIVTGLAAWNVLRDTSRRALAETELKASELKYRMLVNGINDHAILMLGPTGEIRSWNTGAERMSGYGFADVESKSFALMFPADAVAAGKPQELLRLAAERGEYREAGTRVRADGVRFPVETTYTASRDAGGQLQGYSVISRDLSESTVSGTKYRGLMEAAPDAMVVVNQAGEIVLLNVQAEKQFGYRRDELLGQKVTNIIPVGFAERLIADDLRSSEDALAQQIGTGIELNALRKDGSEFPIEMMLSPLASPEGTLVTAAIRNISVRRSAEKVLAQMEGKYRGLLEAAPDAMVVVNQAGDIVLLNLQAEKQFGYRRDELLGQQVTNIIPEGFAERLVADDLRSEEDALAQEIGTGIELTGRRRDQSEFPIEIMLSPLEDADGMLVTAAVRDISGRKNAEKHLAQMEGKYRGLLEAAPDPIVVVNQAGEIVLLNLQAEKQFGYRRNELLGQKVTNIIPHGFAERLIADGLRSAEDALAQQIGTGIELSARRKDRTEFPIELMLSPLGGAEGILITAAIRNISVRKTAEAQLLEKVEELNRSNEELGQFAYIASHDLQEPLRMVASYTQLLSRRYKGKLDSDADEFITFAVDGATRMQRLIQDLLAYSRVGTKAKDFLDTSSETALKTALANLRGSIEESGAQVTHDPMPGVVADETQLVQLFQNLIGNAIKYQNGRTPQIHIGATNGGSQCRFSVQDNGLGIDPQYFERIFGMFQRLHKREEFAGTGIGLAICKKIVERHGGHISVESQLNVGSTFRFALPASERV